MKRSLVPAVLFVTLAASSPLVACGGPDQPPAAPAPAATAPPPDLSARPPQSVQPLPVAPAPAPTTAPVAEVLPPPKPTTISLAHTGDEKLDRVLAEGDKAFEDADYTKAAASYKIAMTMAPRRSAPIVGSARVRAVKNSPNLGFAAAE